MSAPNKRIICIHISNSPTQLQNRSSIGISLHIIAMPPTFFGEHLGNLPAAKSEVSVVASVGPVFLREDGAAAPRSQTQQPQRRSPEILRCVPPGPWLLGDGAPLGCNLHHGSPALEGQVSQGTAGSSRE